MLPLFFTIQNSLLILALIWFACTKSTSRSELTVRVVAAWAVLIGAMTAGIWYYPPVSGKLFYSFMYAGATALHICRSDRSGVAKLFRLGHVPALLCVSLGGLLIWQGLSGRLAPTDDTIALAPPMNKADGVCVMSGGASLALNLHYLLALTPEGRYEKHSLDFARFDANGVRTRSPWFSNPQPQKLEEYLVYDQPVLAPCSGSVASLENSKEDHPAGDSFRDTSGSNHVTLLCDNMHVVLAHLKKGSVSVEQGQTVGKGHQIGLVGNSGNSEEPHLHINAQTIVSPESVGEHPESVVMLFDGEYLSRGDCL
ncbi:MAG: M23 family metallopeptidase [Erythrobacter sp.]